MKILVTGGTGFIGFNLAKELVKLNHEISITGSGFENPIVKNCSVNSGDFKQEVCFHLAANNDTLCENSKEMFEANFYQPIELFNKLADCGCKKFIYASSTAVYGNNPSPYKETTKTNPLNYYAESKLAFDEFAMNFANKNKVSAIGLRYCNVYGPGEQHKGKRASMIFQIYKQMSNNQKPKIFKYGEQKRDWCYINDVVTANLKCLEYKGSEIFNIGSGKSTSFSRIIQIFNYILNKNLLPDYIDCSFLEKYQNNTQCDILHAKKKLGWKPEYDIEKGIEDYFVKTNIKK